MTVTRYNARFPARPGAILLEIVLAMGLFMATAITLLAVVGGAIDSLNQSHDRLTAADHARSAMAMIEAGIARPETLIGPVAPWSGNAQDDSMPSFSDDSQPDDFPAAPQSPQNPLGSADDTGWALEIESEPAEVSGLTLVIVRAHRVDDDGTEIEDGSSFTLRQILKLSGAPPGGDEDLGFDIGTVATP